MRLGCFGSAICFNYATEQCQKCSEAQDCLVAANKNLSLLNQDVKTAQELETKHTRWARKLDIDVVGVESLALDFKLDEQERVLVSELPKAARPLISSIVAKGYNLKNILKTKSNPFHQEKPIYLASAWSVVLGNTEFSTKELTAAFKASFPQWTMSTVYSHVAIVTKVFTHLGVIESLGCKQYRVLS